MSDILADECNFLMRACGCDQSRSCQRCKGLGEYRVPKSSIPTDGPEPPGRVDVQVLAQEPDAIRKIVDEKVKSYLAKYGFTYTVTRFAWDGGQVSGMIDLVPIPPQRDGEEK